MKTKNYQPTTQNEIPDGEGFTALPIFFCYLRIAQSRAYILPMIFREREEK